MTSSRRRIGVIGLGMASAPHAQSLIDLADRVEVAGCFSPSAERRAAFAARHGLPVVDRLETLLEDPTLSAVLLLTPPDSHAGLVARCAAADKHVLLEKPLDATPEGARAAVSAMEASGLTLGVVLQHRFRASVERLAALMRDGTLGRPLTAAVSVRWWRDAAYYAQPGRGMKARDGGGVLLTQAIHTLDAARYLSGQDPVSVYCEEFNPAWSWYRGDASATALFTMTGGLRYSYRGSWCAEGRHTGWDAAWRAVGPNGTATWDGEGAPIADVVRERGGFHSTFENRVAAVEEIPAGIAGSLREFLDALDTGATPMGECHDNIKSLAMVLAAIESSRTGGRVPVEI